jgi:hypothetical protein
MGGPARPALPRRAADSRVGGRFEGMPPPSVARLESNGSDQLCEATGGT